MTTKHNEPLSIVMPCLNEEKTLPICIDKAFSFLASNNIEGEIIIADNGSTDASVQIAESKGARVIHVKEKGYGSALRSGIEAAKYQNIVMGDADDSYDFLNLSPFVEKLNEGYELVMGNRFKGGIEKGAMSFSHKYIGNPVLSGIGRIFFKTNIKDFHCGLRAFKKDAIKKLNLRTTGMEFASEMVVKSVLFNLKTTEVPCKLYPDGRDRPPHLRSIPDGLRHLEFLLLYSPKWLFAIPGIILFASGLILTTILFIKPISIGGIQLETTTMLYCSIAMIIGFQFIQLATFTTIYSQRIGQFPNTAKLSNKINKFISNYGYHISAILLIASIIGILYTFISWASIGFGQLTTNTTYRFAILFGSLLSLSIELFAFTLFSRILEIKD